MQYTTSVGTPTIVPSSRISIIGGDSVILTCKTKPEDIGGAKYHWKRNTTKLYVENNGS